MKAQHLKVLKSKVRNLQSPKSTGPQSESSKSKRLKVQRQKSPKSKRPKVRSLNSGISIVQNCWGPTNHKVQRSKSPKSKKSQPKVKFLLIVTHQSLDFCVKTMKFYLPKFELFREGDMKGLANMKNLFIFIFLVLKPSATGILMKWPK